MEPPATVDNLKENVTEQMHPNPIDRNVIEPAATVDNPKENVTKQMYQREIKRRDKVILESWVKTMEVRLVRDELEKCRKGEGPNAMESCRWLAEKYMQMLQDNKLKGYKVIERA